MTEPVALAFDPQDSNPHEAMANDGGQEIVQAVVPGEARPATDAGPESTEELPDIGAASFPADFNEAIFGQDERVQIHTTDQFPFRVNASLRIIARDGSLWIGTAWFVSPRTLITAGHCVFIKNSGLPSRDGWVRSIAVMPGRNGQALPFGTVTATSFRTVRGWSEQGDQRFDYGAIILNEPLGTTVGTIGYGVLPDNELVGVEAHVTGYPSGKPQGTMWDHALPIGSVDPKKVFYTIDTTGGQSGAAVYVMRQGLPLAVAIHAYGGSVSNSGTRINQEVFDNLRRWSV